jgi:putative addiction module component (TIGR02574 family)
MTAILRQLGIDRMTIAERIALAQEILDSVVAEQPRPALSEAKRRELDRRLADHAANPADAVPWEEVESAARARFARGTGTLDESAPQP